MDTDSENGLLAQLAAGELIEKTNWPEVRDDVLSRLSKISHDDFPIPKLPPPRKIPAPVTDGEGHLVSPISSSPPDQSSQDADKENAPVQPQPSATQELEPGQLPKQIADMLEDITTHLKKFDTEPPHTIQRLAELVLRPRAHYKALAPYLHAVDRVVRVTSSVAIYPLPPVVPDLNGQNGEADPAAQVSWGNSTTSTLGTDEALGGALLTPIPWLTKSGSDSGVDTPGAQIHCESTETIDGPNGVGSIETVSVSFNGIPSTGHTRGVTQGELLRQEQRAGVVPVNQLNRPSAEEAEDPERKVEEGEEGERGQSPSKEGDEEEEVPHARGPEEIGVDDLGPQKTDKAYSTGHNGLDTQDIDVEAAVGRKHGEEDAPATESEAVENSPGADSTGSKREAEQELEGEPAKKQAKAEEKQDGDEAEMTTPKADSPAAAAEEKTDTKPDAADADADKMETDN